MGRVEGTKLTFVLSEFDFGNQVGFGVAPTKPSPKGEPLEDQVYEACRWSIGRGHKSWLIH